MLDHDRIRLWAAQKNLAVADLHALQTLLEQSLPDSDESRQELASNADLISLFLRILEELPRAVASGSPDLLTAHRELATIISKTVAEAAKTDAARPVLAKAGLIPALVAASQLSTRHGFDGLTVQTFRAFGNLCFDNESNRDAIAATDGIPCIVESLGSSDPHLVTVACGALWNTSMDHEPVQVQILRANGLGKLIEILKRATSDSDGGYAHLKIQSLRIIHNLAETDEGVAELIKGDDLLLIFKVLKQQHAISIDPSVSTEAYEEALEVLETLTTILEAIGEKDDAQRYILAKNCLGYLLDFVDHPSTKRAESEQDKDEAINYEEIRKAVSRVVTLVTMNDANMTELPQHPDIIGRLKQWLKLGFDKNNADEDDEIRMSGALCIGNLARSDLTCAILVQKYDVCSALIELLYLEGSRLKKEGVKETTKSCVKVLHAVVGALKNLSIAVDNRPIMGSLGTIAATTSLLELDDLKPVQYGCVGILKNLCSSGNNANIIRVLTGSDPLLGQSLRTITSVPPKAPFRQVISLIWRSTNDSESGIRNEGGRMIGNIIRAIHTENALALMKCVVDANCIPPLIQIITGALLTKKVESTIDSLDDEERHVHFDALPLETQVYHIVQNEGLVAMILLCDAYPPALSIVVQYHSSLLPMTQNILKSGLIHDEETPRASVTAPPPPVYSAEVKINTATFCRALLANGDFARRAKDDLLPILKAVQEKLEASLDAVAEKPVDNDDSGPARLGTPLPVATGIASASLGSRRKSWSTSTTDMSVTQPATVEPNVNLQLRAAITALIQEFQNEMENPRF
ncbi:armadillo-type protein [Polychytrium aggregatum]|uniref:armadillo-type protein n=1 Tax=Polychytrium aggregatum TaxID=110093 RepID=UPI0022FF42D2|nr:armadillo-type protein [Polychytrium aggregatum]KAI9207738.1 armadillo-type protein [Polychytrium aggregatum]